MGKLAKRPAIENQARSGILESIPAMTEQAKQGNVQAFDKLLKAGGIGESKGISINNMVGVDARNHGNTEADWKFFQKFRGRLDASLLRKGLPPPDEGDDVPEKKQDTRQVGQAEPATETEQAT